MLATSEADSESGIRLGSFKLAAAERLAAADALSEADDVAVAAAASEAPIVAVAIIEAEIFRLARAAIGRPRNARLKLADAPTASMFTPNAFWMSSNAINMATSEARLAGGTVTAGSFSEAISLTPPITPPPAARLAAADNLAAALSAAVALAAAVSEALAVNDADAVAMAESFACSAATAPGAIRLIPIEALTERIIEAIAPTPIKGAIAPCSPANAASNPARLTFSEAAVNDSEAIAPGAIIFMPSAALMLAIAAAVADKFTASEALIAALALALKAALALALALKLAMAFADANPPATIAMGGNAGRVIAIGSMPSNACSRPARLLEQTQLMNLFSPSKIEFTHERFKRVRFQ